MTNHKRIFPAVLTVISAMFIAGCTEEPAPKVESRTIIVGFDGMDPRLAAEFMEKGLLPNFSRLAEQGEFAPLQTTNPPQSPVSWSSFATGTHPGEHGIYDFLRRHADTYLPDFSISETRLPEDTFGLFGYDIPLSDAQIINRRQGQPFWQSVEERGGRSTVLRVPVTFPPDDIHRMLSGMGVPDLLGTQGTYTIYTTRPLGGGNTSARVVRMRPDRDGLIETTIEGPIHPLKPEAGALELPLAIRPSDTDLSISVDGEDAFILAPGEWSQWVPISFSVLGVIPVDGVVRFRAIEGFPRPLLYMSPIQIDPHNPVVPLSSPPDYAADLADRIGMFHTIGMPEETWSLNEGHIPDAAFLEMEKTILAEREAMFYDSLDRQDSDLVIGVFVQTDRVSHMFYRGIDPEHPLYGETDETGRGAIEWIYKEADRVLGETMERMGPNDELIVISDHGFSPFRWAVNLNRWLVDEGYLVLKDGANESDVAFSGVDWSRSRAYAVGLNGLYLNLAGREAKGIVTAGEVEALKAELSERLVTIEHQGDPVIRRIFDGAKVYPGNSNGDAPDLVIGYDRGYRASWQTTLGAVPATLVDPNDRKWSGDHCVDPELVPGILFTSRAGTGIESISDIASYVLK